MPTGPESTPQLLEQLRRSLSLDGHFIKNSAALIAQQSAVARDLFPDDAQLQALEQILAAMSGSPSLVPREIISNLTITYMALGRQHNRVMLASLRAGVFSLPHERLALRSVGKQETRVLREAAMRLTYYNDALNPEGTLGEKIEQLSSPNLE
jgi:hypothetical protein